ncbi:LptF/LptG family permease [Rhodopirellula sp. P2]|uniref:LptF/LptG family permease n=1 Tax=Rhodopirellula sp. P2 TaxID=2127060 RepID=UPI00236744D4|nr:LptF/LptG family permease [Rhodopirellula sp. P2]WDQ16469.1 LptF/LptG family permease [Rhodopirellula sp. P2]
MPTTIQLRIACDIVVIFFTSLFVITSLVMCVGVMREAMNQGLGVAGVFRLLPYALPNALSLAVPGTALFSVCCVYGRMSADNEFTAMQSVGISMLPAMWPAIVITTLLSIATVTLINVAFTWGFHGVQNVVLSSVEKIAYGVLQREHQYAHDPFSLRVREVHGKDLIDPSITIRRGSGPAITINARTATLRYDAPTESIEMSVTDGHAEVEGQASFYFPDTFTHVIPLNATPKYDLLTAHPSHMPMSDLPLASRAQSHDIVRRENEMAVHTGFDLLASRTERSSSAEALSRTRDLVASRQRLHRLATEMHRRWASGFTCFAMSMIGIPFGIRMKASDTMTTFGIVFLPTVLIYYPIFAATLDMAKDGRLPPQGVWIANLIFVFVGVLMMRRLVYKPA